MSIYECAAEYEKEFDITNWRFYMAFEGEVPVGAMTIAGKTKGLNMLYGREDACVLWDIRIADAYKHQGIGQKLLDMSIAEAKKSGYNKGRKNRPYKTWIREDETMDGCEICLRLE